MLGCTANWNLLMRMVRGPTVPQTTPQSRQSIAICYQLSHTHSTAWWGYYSPGPPGLQCVCKGLLWVWKIILHSTYFCATKNCVHICACREKQMWNKCVHMCKSHWVLTDGQWRNSQWALRLPVRLSSPGGVPYFPKSPVSPLSLLRQ